MTEPNTQPTQPKKGKPIEIPVPKRDEFDRLLAKAEKPPKKPYAGAGSALGSREPRWDRG